MDNWQSRAFGNTGLKVSALGFGAGHIGGNNLSESEAASILNGVLEAGITLIDTARGYGLSEERIGRHLKHRRSEFVLSTKIGYGIPGYQDWTGAIITVGIEAALKLLQTEYIDIVHLHSCELGVLVQGEVTAALEAAVQAGKVRVAAYSGDNAPLEWAVKYEGFKSIEASINFCDQRIIDNQLVTTQTRNLGVIAKRPIANAPWRFSERPVGNYAEEYWLRWQAMALDRQGYSWNDLALRFAAYLPGVSSCIVGTRSLEHLKENIEVVSRGALPDDISSYLRQSFQTHDDNWGGQT